jgi:hypothetical protein
LSGFGEERAADSALLAFYAVDNDVIAGWAIFDVSFMAVAADAATIEGKLEAATHPVAEVAAGEVVEGHLEASRQAEAHGHGN